MNILNLISKSKIRQKIILLFIYNPQKEYYLNQVARLVGTSAGNTRRELGRLVEADFLTKEKKGNALYFKINSGNTILPDIKSIVDKTIGLKHILAQELRRLKAIDFSFLFGSYVKGDFRDNSDIDLYVIGKISEKALYPKIKSAEKRVYREINYHLSTMPEFKENLKKSFFLKEILKNFTLVIGDEIEFRKLIK